MAVGWLALGYSVVMAFVCAGIWRSKGGVYSSGFLLGLFLGVFGLAYVGFARPTVDDMDCPNCAEVIKCGARQCRFCGFELEEEDV